MATALVVIRESYALTAHVRSSAPVVAALDARITAVARFLIATNAVIITSLASGGQDSFGVVSSGLPPHHNSCYTAIQANTQPQTSLSSERRPPFPVLQLDRSQPRNVSSSPRSADSLPEDDTASFVSQQSTNDSGLRRRPAIVARGEDASARRAALREHKERRTTDSH